MLLNLARNNRAPGVALVEQLFDGIEQKARLVFVRYALSQPQRTGDRSLGERTLKMIEAGFP